jgi:flagellar protein FliO/FliZ
MSDALASVPIALGALAVVLALVWLLARLARHRLLPLRRPGARRLVMQEIVALDTRRRLCLVRCDNRSLLLLTGGAQDVVVGWLPGDGAP